MTPRRWWRWLLGSLALAACASPPPATDPNIARAATPVVVISIDTLRADRLPAYGYAGVATPALDTLAGDGIVFDNAYSHTPLTLPSHASLLTGLLPADHGVRDNVGYVLDRDAVASGALPSLPTLLQQAGYATAGGVSSFVLRGKTGIGAGFDRWEDGIEFRSGVGLGGLQRPGGETLDALRDWLDSAAQGPFFLFFHLYEPHTPYQPPEPFASRYPSPYDGEIAAADAVVGRLLERLRALDAYDRALIVLLSDHGEGLGDHGESEHGVLLYREAIHVPLIVKLPDADRGGSRIEAPAGLVDVAPTVADLLGLDRPDAWRGPSLLTLDDPDVAPRAIYSETFYPRLHFGWSDLASLIDDRHHLIDGPDPELYDVVADPAERRDVLAEARRPYAALRAQLEGYDRSLEAPAPADDESRQALQALGYIGSAAPVAGPLPDPKDRLETLVDLKAGFHHHGRQEHREAADAFRRALVDNPQMLDAWEYLARSLQALGRYEDALEAYTRALEISSGAPHLAISAASLYFELGRLEEAAQHARIALDSHSSFAHGLLAQVALAEGDLDLAEREARQALDDTKPRLGPNITLAAVLHARDRYEEARELIAATKSIFAAREARDPQLIRGLYVLEGKVEADLGDTAAAEASFRREIELFAEDSHAYANLAVLYALSGRGAQVGPLLQRMVEARPVDTTYAEAVRTLRTVGDDRSADALLRHARGRFPGSAVLASLTGSD